MEASGEGNFSVSMNAPSSAPFQKERLGLGFYPPPRGGCTCESSNGDSRLNFFGLKPGQLKFLFLGGCRKLALFF